MPLNLEAALEGFVCNGFDTALIDDIFNRAVSRKDVYKPISAAKKTCRPLTYSPERPDWSEQFPKSTVAGVYSRDSGTKKRDLLR